MIDLEKVKKVKLLGLVLSLVLAFVLGFGVGGIGKSSSDSKKAQTKAVKTEPGQLTQAQVEDFLMAYFTKKDLGENRKRYKEYMTEALYNQEVAKEEEPVNKTYQGFVVDFKYKSAQVFIDDKDKTALAVVKYSNTLLAKKNDYEGAQKDMGTTSTLRLTYTSGVDGKLRINKMDPVLISDPNTANLSTYNTIGASSTSSTEEASQTTASSQEGKENHEQ